MKSVENTVGSHNYLSPKSEPLVISTGKLNA
jgi:hypothetical protein